MKFFSLFVFIIFTSQIHSQSVNYAIGAEVKTNFWQKPINMASLTGEVLFQDSSILIRGSFGGFFPKYSGNSDQWQGKLYTFGITGGYYLRAGKKYQPGLTFEVNTMFAPPGTESGFSQVLSNNLGVSGAKFRNIPLAFSPKLSNIFWSDNLGIELGVGYRYYLRHLQSDYVTNFYRPMHTIEWTFGFKFRLN